MDAKSERTWKPPTKEQLDGFLESCTRLADVMKENKRTDK